MERAVIYCRVSTPGQAGDDRYSLPEQAAKGEARCLERGYQIIRTLREVHSGYELDERPEMTILRGMMARSECDVVIMTELDRLSRNMTHQEVLAYEASKFGIRFEMTEEHFEDTPLGHFHRVARGAFAEMEREETRRRTMTGKQARAKRGRLIPGRMPLYGYAWNKDRTAYLVHPVTSKIVVQIFEWVAAGWTLNGICTELVRRGVPTPSDQWRMDKGDPLDPPRGDVWRKQTLHKLLTHPAYVGKHTAFRFDYTHKRRTTNKEGRPVIRAVRRERAVEDRIPIETPALISDELARAALARLEHNRAESIRNNHGPITALLRSGYVKCAQCGRNLYVHRNTTNREQPSYFCPSNGLPPYTSRCTTSRMRVDKLDALVWDRVMERLKHPGRIRHHFTTRQNGQDRTQDTLEGIEARLKEIKQRQTNLARGIAAINDTDAAAPLYEEARKLADRYRDAEAQRQQLLDYLSDRAALQERMTQLADWCEMMGDAIGCLDYDAKRLFLYALSVDVRLGAHSEWSYTDVFTEQAEHHESGPDEMLTLLSSVPILTIILLVGNATPDPVSLAAIAAAAAITLAACWVAMRLSAPIQARIGVTGILVLSRVLGMLLAAIAVQFILNGIALFMAAPAAAH
jgi:site-specific DNA recombinase